MGNCSKFVQYLRDNINLCVDEKVLDDGTKFVSFEQDIDNAGSVQIVVDFGKKENSASVRIYDIAKIESPLKQDELLRLINELNVSYKFFKFAVEEDGNVYMGYDVKISDSYDFQELVTIVLSMYGILAEKCIRKFKKLQWS